MELRNAKVLVTGGAGLVGSHIVDELLREGVASVKIFDNFSRGRMENIQHTLASGRVEVIRADLTEYEPIRAAMEGIDVLFHQAAIRITQCAEEPRLAFNVLGLGTLNAVEAAVAAKVKKVVAASTASVYGLADHFPTREDHHPYNNRTLYGALKVFNEGLLRSYNDVYGLNYVALRYFNVYGPRMDTVGAFTEVFIRWMDKIRNGAAPMIFGTGSQTMDFIYVGDIAKANILAAKTDVCDRVFNVASGTETSLNELALALLRVMGSNLKPEYGPERKVNAVSRRLASTENAEQLLGFKASVSLDDGLRSLVDWWLSQGATR